MTAIKKTLFFHAGMPKTATTLVQDFFASSPELARCGIHYPLPGRPDDQTGHHLLGQAVNKGETAHSVELFDSIKPGAASCLLSSESFTNSIADPSKRRSLFTLLEHAMRGFDRRVFILFLCEASRFFESMYLQTMRAAGLTEAFETYLAGRKFWYAQIFEGIEQLATQIPEMQLEIRAFTSDRLKPDWEEILGIELDMAIDTHINPRLSLKTQLFLRDYELYREPLGMELSRRQALIAFRGYPAPFADDMPHFTLYKPGLAEQVRAEVIAQAHGAAGAIYKNAFGLTTPRPTPPYIGGIEEMGLEASDQLTARAFLLRHAPSSTA